MFEARGAGLGTSHAWSCASNSIASVVEATWAGPVWHMPCEHFTTNNAVIVRTSLLSFLMKEANQCSIFVFSGKGEPANTKLQTAKDQRTHL